MNIDPFADANSPPCDGCPMALLDEYLAGATGRLIGQAIDLDFALQEGVTIRMSDIPYPEFLLLRFLNEERIRYNNEEASKRT